MKFDGAGSPGKGVIRVLLVGNAESVAELRNELQRGGYEPFGRQVHSEERLTAALEEESWDVAICEDGSGAFGGPAALKLIKQARPDLPVIVVSSLFGESIAAAAMKAGADDFLSRGYLARLVPAVEREVGAARARRGWQEASQGLQEIRSRTDAFMNNSPTVASMKDEAGRFVYVNRGFEEVFGIRLPDVLGKTAAELFSAERAAIVRQHELAVLSSGAPIQFEERVPTPEGERFWLVSRFPFSDAAGRRFVGGVAVDITERKRAETALRTSEDLFRDLMEHSHALICIHDLEGTILTTNSAAERTLGYETSADFCREVHRIQDILTPEAQQGFGRYLVSLKETGVASGMMSVRTRTGEHRYWEYRNTMRTEGVERPVVRGVAIDVTDRISAERSLERAQEVGHIGSWVSGVDDGSLAWSRETCRIFGIDPRKFDGKLATFFARVHPDDRDAVETALRESLESIRPYRIEHRVVRGDGSEVWVYGRADVVRDASGKPVRMEGIVQDITERRRLEERFLQAQKMEAIGRLAGGVAHDFNNLLTAILGYTDLLLQQLPPSDSMRDDLEQIRNAGDRAVALTRQLLAFSRRQMLEPRVIDVNLTIQNLEKMLRRILGDNVRLQTALHPELELVRADPGQLEQVIVNLIVNSRDAMPSGGTITISTRSTSLDDALDVGRYAIEPGAYVMIEVRDTGSGMDAATLARIFEPFFTTKEKGKGTGLGLATAYGIVKQSGGYIGCQSEPGQGTCFQIFLPRSFERPEDATTSDPGERDGLRGTETVLLVEDEEGVRRLSRRLLEAHGYLVLEASGGEEALEFAARYPDPIHLLLTDVVMPGLSGPELAGKIRAVRPQIKVLFMTGYSDSAVMGLDPDQPLLHKPFTPDALAHRVRETLVS